MIALNAIFKAYVRGNALHGSQSANGVEVGGSVTSFDKFLLQGKCMFVFVCVVVVMI